MTLTVTGLRVDEGALDLEAAPGSLVVITGDPVLAGAALEAVAGVRTASTGSVTFEGAPIDPLRVGLALGDHPLVGALTARENVALRLLALGLPADAGEVDALLASVLLPEAVLGNLVEQLSGGQQQRVAVARALAGHPPLICLDDPTSELDGSTAEAVIGALRAAADAGAVVVISSADPVPGADRTVEVVRTA